MAVTKEQMAKWSKNFEARYPNEKKNTGTGTQTRTQTTAVRQVTAAQMNQWEQGYQTMQANREREELNRTSPMTNKVTLAQQAAARNPVQTGTAAQTRLPTRVTTTKQPEWTQGTRKVLGTVTADELARNVLGYMSEPEKSNTGSPVKTDRQEDYEPDWNYAGNDNTPKQRAIAQGTYGSYAKAAQEQKEKFEQENATPDRFKELNNWMDADPRHRELVKLMRMKGNQLNTDTGIKETDWASQDTGGKKATYSPGDLLKMGYTAKEINEARAYIREYDSIPNVVKDANRVHDLLGSWVDSPLGYGMTQAETGVQIFKENKANNAELKTWMEEKPYRKELVSLIRNGKDVLEADPNGVGTAASAQYTDRELIKKGYSQSEINEVRQKLEAVSAHGTVDTDTSLGYQWMKQGQKLGQDALEGLNPTAKTLAGIASSAGQNLTVAATLGPEAVLPMLSGSGAADAMLTSIERGDPADKVFAQGALKFGAGWAINSVGAADLAKTMGADYAKETVAGRIADFVRGLSGSSEFAKAYPVVANAISGGIDNAMQAFVETYADTAIDAVLGGDQESAEALLKPETFLQAVQSGLTGGASGALGGAVGTGLGKMNAVLEERSGPTRQERAKQAQELAERMLEPGELEQQASPAEERQEAAPAAQTEQPGETARAEEQTAVPAVQSDNAAVQRYAAAVQADSLTNKTLDLFTPKAANAENRAALAEAYGVELPATASETRRMRQLAQEQRTAAETETGELAQTAEPMQTEPAAQVEAPAADPGQSTVEKAGESVESGQGYSVSMSNDTMTVRFADGTEAVRKIDPENPRTMLFDPEQLHRQAQAESRAEAPQEIPAEYADVELKADPAALKTDSWTRGEQLDTARTLARNARMSTQAVQTVVNNMPEGIGAEIYAPAAASLYRLGVNGEGASFDEALRMTGRGSALSGRVQQVLALGDAGRTALNLAYLQGKGEAERYQETRAAELGKRPGKAALREDAGTYYKADGSVSTGTRAEDALIELSAKASGVAAQRVVQGLKNHAKGLLQSAAGKVFYSSEADTATVMHETLHELNRWDNAGGQELISRFEHYLVEQDGMDSVQDLVQSYLDRYERAGQKLTYNQAMEEITADAMRSIFGTEESFRNFLRMEAAEAKMNAQAQGRCDRVMQKIETLLQKVLTDIQTLLGAEPDNAAAKAAQTLTETQLKDLRQLYFNHQADAGANYRAALEANGGMEKAAAADAAAAEGERYSIDPDYAEKIDEWNKEGRSDNEVFILGSTGDTLQGLGARESDIYMNSDKINRILHDHPEMTLNEIKRIPEVLDDPVMVLTSQNKGRSQQNTRLVMFGSVKAKDGRPVMCILDLRPVENHIVINDMQKLTSAYTKDTNPVQFVRDSEVLYASENKKRTTALLRSLGFEMPSELQPCGSIGSIAYTERSVKLEGVKFTELEGIPGNRYQLDVDSEDVEAARRQSVGDGGAETETLAKVMAQADAAQVSDESLERIARKMVKTSDSRADAKTLTSRLQALRNYLGGGDVDWAQAHGFVLDMAQQIMEGSAKKNDELWKAYPDLHKMGMSLQKGSKDYNEVLYKYGSWAEARKELARHGINLTLTKNGEVSRWDADFTELQKIGAGLLPDETPSSAADALEAMAAAHDAIRPTMESAYDSDWDAAKQELAMDIWNEYLGLPGVANRRNAKLRAEFKARTEQMNEQAKRHSLALQAQANLNAAMQRGTERQKMRQYYAKGQAESEIRLAKAQIRHEQQLAKLRDSRDKDNTRRAIRKATSQLTKMFEHPKENQYVPEYLLDKVRPVLQLANEAIGNRDTAQRLAQWAHERERKLTGQTGPDNWTYEPMQDSKEAMEETVHGLRQGINREIKHSDRALLEWENSGIQDAIDEWIADVNANREQEIEALQAKIEDAKQYTREDESPSWTAYLDRLNDRLAVLEKGGMATLSSSELRGLRDIIDQTLHIIKIDNVVVGATEDVMIDEFAERAKAELTDAKGMSRKPGARGKVSRALNGYKMNTMNIERMFERLGGYTHGGAMENLGRMLNDGQRKKTKILIEGTRVFDELTGPAHEKELYHFTHDLIDIGLRDDSGKARKITHDQLAELALQLQNRQGVHHILNGGLTLENMEAKLSGDAGLAKLDKATVRVGQLAVTDEAGNKLDAAALSQNEDAERRTLLDEVDKHLTDYDRAWMAAFRKANALMTGYINETSMLLSGVKKATTENYIHINVDQDTNPEQNKGIRYDNSAANPGFLNHRVNSSKPVLLVGLVQQAETSIENTAQYAGMAVPLRNAEKVLNSMQGGRTLFGTMEDVWGEPAREYMNKALADLCEVKDSREVGDGVFARLRSYAASAALNANINVTLLQAASLPTAAAELGWGATGSAAVQFGKNLFDLRNVARFFGSDMDSSLTKIEQRMAEHGDELLAYRLRGTGVGEMASANAQKGLLGRTHDAARNSENQTVRGVTKAADKVISLWTAGIGKMDEITVAACWQGSESYVKAHPEEFAAGAEVADSPEYWAAVNEKFQQVVEHTQPNYTTMQRTGFQRSGNAMTKTLMMFSTQRQQNAQILTAAFEDYAAQNEWVKAREKAYKDHPDAESKAALEEAQKAKDQAALRKMNAISSQVVQTAVIAALGVGVKFGLHRWQDLQDDNGDMTLWSVAADFVRQYIKSFGSNWTGVSEAMTAVDFVTSGFTSSRSTISMNGIEVANDIVRKIAKVYQLEAKDTSEMTEKQLDAYNAQMKEAIADMLGQFAAARGIPYANLKKQVQAVTGWMDTLANWNKEGGNFDSLPASATGQYDRLYNAYLNGDTAEAKAAMEKLDGMVEAGIIQENKMYDQMKQRLMQYEPRVTEAAQETNADRWEKRKQLVDQMTDEMKAAFGTNSTDVRDTVVKAVDAKSNELLKAEKGYDKSDSLYAGLRDAVGSGSSQSVQDEYDRLVKAGKKPSSVKNEITKAAKADYVDGSAYDREQMAEMLLRLKDADGKALYEQKTLDGWVKQAEKAAASAEDTADPYADLR